MKKIVLIVGILSAGYAFCQTAPRQPSIGYTYPAGGQQGTIVQVTVGGQYLNGVSEVVISGQGITTSDIRYIPILNTLQRQELQNRLKAIRVKQMQATRQKYQAPTPPREEKKQEKIQELTKTIGKPDEEEKPVKLPPHPLLLNLENLTPYQIKQVSDIFLPFQRLQIKRSIQEMVIVNIRIDADAPPGIRELRLKTTNGLTNPVFFEVGTYPEISETEPNEPGEPSMQACTLPIVFNGQIMPGDADRFCFNGHQGQKLVIETHGRKILPYIADAVPGWFQAVLLLYDSNGREIAYVDDYLFSPDPVIFFTVPHDGEYTVEIRDAIYRGREDFVYRIYVAEKPFITHIFPMGGKRGEKSTVAISGWNLADKVLPLDTGPDGGIIREAILCYNGTYSNPVYYAVDEFPESFEKEPNDTRSKAQKVSIPQTINGCISKPGDVDIFRIEMKAGYELTAEIYGRRLGSPIDSFIRLTDASNRILVSNDDTEDITDWFNTHHADSFISFKAPVDGTYFLYLFDVQGQAGDLYTYRLRISPRRPDFALVSLPSGITLPAGSSTALRIQVIRKEGFEGDIQLTLTGETHGCTLAGGIIPAGTDSLYITLTAPATFPVSIISPHLQGCAVIRGQQVIHPVVPVDEMMQAFAYCHMVPASCLTVSVVKRRSNFPVITVLNNEPVKITKGSGKVQAKIVSRIQLDGITVQLQNPLAGISLGNARFESDILSFSVITDSTNIRPGTKNNLIVEVFANIPVGKTDEQGMRPKRRVSLGILPAIPFEVMEE